MVQRHKLSKVVFGLARSASYFVAFYGLCMDNVRMPQPSTDFHLLTLMLGGLARFHINDVTCHPLKTFDAC